MTRTQRWIVASVGAVTAVGSVTVAIVYGLEQTSWVAGIGSFLAAVAALVFATPTREETRAAASGTDPATLSELMPQAGLAVRDRQIVPQMAALPRPGGMAATSNLPRRNRAFTGRTQLLADMRQALTRGPVAVVAVRGMGGIGKTQLALEYAHQQRQTGRYELTWWIRAESPLTLTTDLAAMTSVLGMTPDVDQERTITAVLAALRQRDKWLLVFDNAPKCDRGA